MSDRWRKLSWTESHSLAAMEKRHYPFRNYRHAAETVLFPGCNFMGIYPRTTEMLHGLLAERLGAGLVYDCCSKPVVDMGLLEEADLIARAFEARMLKHGVRSVITVCPNCHYRMRQAFSRIEVKDVYSVLRLLSEDAVCPLIEDLALWQPCPDRRSGKMLDALSAFLPADPQKVRGVACCGLKGWGRIFDAQTADHYATELAEAGPVRTYCASCVMTVARHGGTQMRHALVELLGTEELPDVAHSLTNRAKGKLA